MHYPKAPAWNKTALISALISRLIIECTTMYTTLEYLILMKRMKNQPFCNIVPKNLVKLLGIRKYYTFLVHDVILLY